MRALPDHFIGRHPLPRIESKNSEHFLRAVKNLAGGGVPCPTTGARQLLRFDQVGFAAAEGFLVSLRSMATPAR